MLAQPVLAISVGTVVRSRGLVGKHPCPLFIICVQILDPNAEAVMDILVVLLTLQRHMLR